MRGHCVAVARRMRGSSRSHGTALPALLGAHTCPRLPTHTLQKKKKSRRGGKKKKKNGGGGNGNDAAAADDGTATPVAIPDTAPAPPKRGTEKPKNGGAKAPGAGKGDGGSSPAPPRSKPAPAPAAEFGGDSDLD